MTLVEVVVEGAPVRRRLANNAFHWQPDDSSVEVDEVMATYWEMETHLMATTPSTDGPGRSQSDS